MATYAELLQAAENDVLRNRIKVACFVAADKVRLESVGTTNHAERLAWAKMVYSDPGKESQRMTWAVIAQNRSASAAAIIGADDATVQAAVDAAVDVFAVS